jgi:hypothetical protein
MKQATGILFEPKGADGQANAVSVNQSVIDKA